MRAPHSLPLVVGGDTMFLPPVDLNVGGVDIDRRRGAQPGLPPHGHEPQYPLTHLRQPGFYLCPL